MKRKNGTDRTVSVPDSVVSIPDCTVSFPDSVVSFYVILLVKNDSALNYSHWNTCDL